jgi:hypothetical protein
MGGVRSSRLVPLAAALVFVTSGAAARSAPQSFRLVFDGRHNAALLHEGTFTTSSSFCPSGSAADVSVEATTDTALRRFTCTGGGGDFSARIAPLPAEHGGTGTWQIVEGTGPLADLRGKGTWTSTRLSGRPDDPATITFRSTWDGVAALDISPPAIGVTSASTRKLKRPKGAYTMRVTLSLTDDGGDPVSYVLQVVDPRKPRGSLIYKLGQPTSGSAALTFRIKPVKGTRAVRVEVVATDAVGNEASATKLLRLK